MKSQIAVFLLISLLLIKVAVILKAIIRNRNKVNVDLIEIQDTEFQNGDKFTILNEVKEHLHSALSTIKFKFFSEKY